MPLRCSDRQLTNTFGRIQLRPQAVLHSAAIRVPAHDDPLLTVDGGPGPRRVARRGSLPSAVASLPLCRSHHPYELRLRAPETIRTSCASAL